MALVRAPMLEKPSPWDQFTHSLNKKYLHCIHNRFPEACADHFHWYFVGHYKGLPSFNNIFTHTSFFSLFHFIAHFFVGLQEPPKFFSFCAFTLFVQVWLMDFNQTWFSIPPMYVCSTCHTVFSLKNTLECVFVKDYYTAG